MHSNFKPKIENWDVTNKKEDQDEKLNEMEILNSSLKALNLNKFIKFDIRYMTGFLESLSSLPAPK